MTVRLYTSLDTGAPALTGDMYNRVRQILLACLVNGYGSKVAAGWTLGHDVTDGFSVGNGAGFMNIVRAGTSAYAAYIMEAITNGSTALAGGVNRRSGIWYDGSDATERQFLVGFSNGLPGATNPHWSVVADGSTCVFMCGGGVTTPEAPASLTHYFGAYHNTIGLEGVGRFCSLGGGPSSGSSPYFGSSTQRNGAMLRNPFDGLVEQGVTPRCGATGPIHPRGSTSVTATPKMVPNRLYPVRAGLTCFGAGLNGATTSTSASLAGYLRGVISEPTLCGATLTNVLTLFGLPLTWQARVTPITLPGGTQWVPLYVSPNDAAFFVSLDPADWE